MIDLLEIYRDHCPFDIEATEVKDIKTVYRAHCFGVYDALRSVASCIGDRQLVQDLEAMHRDTVGEEYL